MEVFFLDDCPHRTRFFLHILPAAYAHKTSESLISGLRNRTEYIDYLFLDHNLSPGNSSPVVEWLTKNKMGIGIIVLHSSDLHAVQKSYEKLKNHYNVKILSFDKILQGKWTLNRGFIYDQ